MLEREADPPVPMPSTSHPTLCSLHRPWATILDPQGCYLGSALLPSGQLTRLPRFLPAHSLSP